MESDPLNDLREIYYAKINMQLIVLNLSPKLLIDRKFRSHQKQSLDFIYNTHILQNYFRSYELAIDIIIKYYYSLNIR